MKKILFIFITIFQATIHAMSFEKVPIPVMQEIIKLTADNEQNLKQVLLAKRVSKYWHTLIRGKQTQTMLQQQKLLLQAVYKSHQNLCIDCKQTNDRCTCNLHNWDLRNYADYELPLNNRGLCP